MKQAPTMTEKEVAELLKRDISQLGGGGDILAHAPRIVTRRRLRGETVKQAKARWEREAEIQHERDIDPSIGAGGRRLPVRYDD